VDPWSNGSLCREGACLRGSSGVQNKKNKRAAFGWSAVSGNAFLQRPTLHAKGIAPSTGTPPPISGTDVIASWIQPVNRMHSQHMVARSRDTMCTSQTDLTNQIMCCLQASALSPVLDDLPNARFCCAPGSVISIGALSPRFRFTATIADRHLLCAIKL